MIDILGISGSLRAQSYNTALLRAARELAGRTQRLKLWCNLGAIPPFNEDCERDPGDAVRAMRAAVENADAILIAAPEYNTTLPGQLKNALDWLSRPTAQGALVGKPVAVVGASQSAYGAEWSRRAVGHVAQACGARLVEASLGVARCDTAFTATGWLRDQTHRAALADVLTHLTSAAHGSTSCIIAR